MKIRADNANASPCLRNDNAEKQFDMSVLIFPWGGYPTRQLYIDGYTDGDIITSPTYALGLLARTGKPWDGVLDSTNGVGFELTANNTWDAGGYAILTCAIRRNQYDGKLFFLIYNKVWPSKYALWAGYRDCNEVDWQGTYTKYPLGKFGYYDVYNTATGPSSFELKFDGP